MEDYDMFCIMQMTLKYLKAYKDQNVEVMDEDDVGELDDLIEDVSEIVEMNGGEV